MLWPSKIQFAICEFCVQHNGIYFQSMVRYMRLTDTVYTTHHLPIQVYYLHIFKCYRIVRVLIKKELIVILLLFFFSLSLLTLELVMSNVCICMIYTRATGK